MTDAIAYTIVGLLLVQALWRAPAALRGRARERSLWGTFTALALAWLMRTALGRFLVDHIGVADLATLLKHTITIAAMCTLLRYLTAVDAGELASGAEPSRRVRITSAVHRHAGWACALTIAVMAGVFLFWLHRTEVPTSPYFMERHAGEAGLAVYMGLFYVYSGAVTALCGYQWGSKARHAPRRTLRVGLWLMAVGMAVATLYCAVRAVCAVWNTVSPMPEGPAAVQEAVTDTLLYGAFLLWAIGVIAPTIHVAVLRYRTLAAIRRLHRLWRDLAFVVPDLVLYPPSRILPGSRLAAPLNTARDIFAHDASPQIRLGRYVTEIRDAIHELRRRAPEDLYQHATELAAAETAGRPADAVAEAYWIRAAMASADRPVGSPVPFPSGRGESLAAEVPWLLTVADAYASANPTATVRLLGAATPA
ncbi:MAB_1171c family putative transporter [Streptomyces sp. NPDC057743]|uniref:MAB_1171c family putative transporter n=1 Tax=Streptomyces sp. NPDC057743 TaxID=3346236 RepID=UPI0036CEE9FB